MSRSGFEAHLPRRRVNMFVVVEHAITDPGASLRLSQKPPKHPPGIKALQFFPSTSSDRAVCLWEAKSVEAVKSFL